MRVWTHVQTRDFSNSGLFGKDAEEDVKKQGRRRGDVIRDQAADLFFPGKPAGRGHAELPRE